MHEALDLSARDRTKFRRENPITKLDMPKTYHHSTNIEQLLRLHFGKKIDFLYNSDGKNMSDFEARTELAKRQSIGHKLIPRSIDCKNFDPFGAGCPGHEISERHRITTLESEDKFRREQKEQRIIDYKIKKETIRLAVVAKNERLGVQYSKPMNYKEHQKQNSETFFIPPDIRFSVEIMEQVNNMELASYAASEAELNAPSDKASGGAPPRKAFEVPPLALSVVGE